MAEFRFRDDDPHEEPAVTLDAFLEQPDAHAVRQPGLPARCAAFPYRRHVPAGCGSPLPLR